MKNYRPNAEECCFLKTARKLGMLTGIRYTGISVLLDNGGSKKGEDRALFKTQCETLRLKDIFTTNKPLVLI
ncbi:hypothetical protein E2C01_061794 [Portunus trituberculatus]|uniref:Uncharacterized protein n=1 Tax=Portunus trituberculatus TaxID=210409 RepID=A0A5B7HE96_PORTR|nr:hypothetical protein [Portunus trituberculatus]